MRFGVIFALTAAVLAGGAAQAAEISDARGLMVVFIHTIPDICAPTVAGRPLPAASAGQLQAVPPDAPIRKNFPDILEWRASRAFPDNLFVGTGDKPNNCFVVLANTRNVREDLTQIAKALANSGFTGRKTSPTEVVYTLDTNDGVVSVSLQPPHDAVNDGKDLQTGYLMTLTKRGAKTP